MPDVKIKLEADGSQVRRELKLIDKEMQQLGGKGAGVGGTTTKPRTSAQQAAEGSQKAGTQSPEEKEHQRTLTQIQYEMAQLRKELQKFNTSPVTKSAPSSTPASQPTPSSAPTPSSGGSDTGSSPSETPNSPSSKLGGVIGKLASAIAGIGIASKAIGYVTQGAQQARSGESLAYQTYGRTLAYTDYYTAKSDSYDLGINYGYDYGTVMAAGDANMNRAGFTNLENYKADSTALLGTAKAFGLDPTQLASTSGGMAAIGVTKSGSQKEFANLLAESIVQANMQGRESEQLQVLEGIADNLASVNATVSDESLRGSLQMYNALVQNNENLKGARGQEYVSTMQDIAASGNSSLDVLAGFGTKYTGLEGKQQLRMLAEENPDAYWKQVIQGAKQYGIGDAYLLELIAQQTGSYNKAQEIMNGAVSLTNGEGAIESTEAGEEAIQQRLENYDQSKVSTQEQYELNKQNVQEDIGNASNNLFSPLRDWFNGLGGAGQTAVTVGGGAAGAAGTWGAAKVGGKAFQGAVKGAQEAASAAEAAGESAGLGAVAKGAAKGATEGGKEALSGMGKTAAKIGAKAGGKAIPVIGSVITGGIAISDAVEAHNEGDDKGAAEAIGGGAGGIIGGIGGGAAAGAAIGSIVPGPGTAIGAIIGGIVGGIGGEVAGRGIGGSIYDALNGYPNGEPLESDWSNAGYWRQQVTDRWNDIKNSNISSDEQAELIQKYGFLIGNPDKDSAEEFLKATEQYAQEENSNTSAMEENTEALNKLTEEMGGRESGGFGGGSKRLDSDAGWTTKDENGSDSAQQSAAENINGLSGGRSASSSSTAGTTTNSDNATSSNSGGGGIFDGIGDFFGGIANSVGNFFGGLFGGTDHAVGADYIPYDDYPARLHRGEMVLNKMEADQYRRSSTDHAVGAVGDGSNLTLNIVLSGQVQGMTRENQNMIVNAVVQKIQGASNLTSMLGSGFERRPNY